jgi:hypothetical protein
LDGAEAEAEAEARVKVEVNVKVGGWRLEVGGESWRRKKLSGRLGRAQTG